jgi:hypothetical protein
MVVRHTCLILLAFIAGIGCSAGTSGGLKRQDPPLTKETLSKTRILAQHNKNAATIQSLKANPYILVAADGRQVKLSGYMAMERPKDFRLEMKFHSNPQADIGSNDQGFWFWIKDNKDKAIYVCDYEHINSSPLAVTMQPEWILEAMGLREITDREAATISAKAADKPGQMILTQLRKDSNGKMVTKETLVNESNGEIIEHRLYAGAKDELLARATISQYQHVELLPTDADPSGSKVAIPSKFRLEWMVEKFALDISMSDLKVNPQFPKEQQAALFTEPDIKGVSRKNLASLGGNPSATSSRIYESAPRSNESAPRSSVRLGRPQADPISVEGSIPSSGEPLPMSADQASTIPQPTGVVGPSIPQGLDSEAVQASGSRRLGRPSYLGQ